MSGETINKTINEMINGGCLTGRTRMTTTPEGKQGETATSHDDRRRDGATTTTPDDDQPMTAPDDNEGEASNGANETRQPDRRTHGKQQEATGNTPPADTIGTAATSKTHERNRPAASMTTPQQATGSGDRGEPKPKRNPYSPRPTCRTSGEPSDTTIGRNG